MAARGFIKVNRDICKECHLCIHVCKQEQIVPTKEYNAKGYRPVTFCDTGKCTGCALCATMCPEIAIEVYRE